MIFGILKLVKILVFLVLFVPTVYFFVLNKNVRKTCLTALLAATIMVLTNIVLPIVLFYVFKT